MSRPIMAGPTLRSVLWMSLVVGVVAQKCNDAKTVCIPGPIDVAHRINNHVGVSASETCGEPPSRYCRMRPLNQCFWCDASNASLSHDVTNIRDRSPTSKWQSPTWWDWHASNPNEPLKANVTVSFNKTYLLTGEVVVVWMSPRPFKMILEKSSDMGRTWSALQYYAENCEKRFNGMVNSDLENITAGNFGVYCTEKYSRRVQENARIKFDFLKRYQEETLWEPRYQEYLSATNVRLRMEYPATDGSENTNKDEDILNQFFYAISDVHITARCQCHGHAEFCDSPNMQGYGCACRNESFTTGPDCEKCLPLYNNKPWGPASSWNQTTVCEKCECHEHADSCAYNKTLDHGVCDDCKHNTTGYFCEQCKVKFYRNMSKALEHPQVCLPCDCYPEGILNNGSCNQTTGQCECRQNVTGRQCNHCEDTFWGYTLPPEGYCQECKCNGNGTVGGDLNCHQTSGQCSCKETIWQKTCSECKHGYYDFPKSENQLCTQCDCDYGGSITEICDKINGTCLCRDHIEGNNCTEVQPGYFSPYFSHLLYEAEFANAGSFHAVSYFTGLGQHFTGRGYGQLSANQFITFYVEPSVNFTFSVALRYTEIETTQIALRLEVISCIAVNCSMEKNLSVSDLDLGKGLALQFNDTVSLVTGRRYLFNLTFIGGQANSSVEIDSLVLLPVVQDTRAYRRQALSKGDDVTGGQIEDCLKKQTAVRGFDVSDPVCRSITFSVMAEVFDGALACGCNTTGSNATECNAFGGQCPCKPGVTGRACDKCMPGYYNFTAEGCQKCGCVETGSVHLVCDPVSGQCPCHPGVVTRTCSRCNDSYFGFDTGRGCTACRCNTDGSVHMQCDDVTGQCPCKNSTDGEKCDRCKENYFNFTSLGCAPCNCHEGGAETLQCNLRTGVCTCKANANGTKCEACKPGTYHSDMDNPDGCSPCFCYRRSKVCSSARHFVKDYKTVDCYNNANCKANVASPAPAFQDVNQTKQIRFFKGSEMNLTLPEPLKGNHLRSYGQRIEVALTFEDEGSLNTSWRVILTGDNNAHSFTLKPEPSLAIKKYHAILHEKLADTPVVAYKFQHDLASLRSVKLGARAADVGSVRVGVISLVTASEKLGGGGDEVGFVENCSCSVNYTSLSCGDCHQGYTRSPPNSGNSNPCVLCSCNNRSRECDPDNGVCENCRIGTEGDWCERCEPNVDNSTDSDCSRCFPEYYGLTEQARGCTPCDCILGNTLYGNNSVCDMTTGQCTCKPKISGRPCDRCHENAYNSSGVCVDCPECYRLIQVEVNKLRAHIKTLGDTIERVKNGEIGHASFATRFYEAQRDVKNLADKSKNATSREETLRREVNKLNQTLNQLEMDLWANVQSPQESLQRNVSHLLNVRKSTADLMSETEDFVNQSYAVLTGTVDPAVKMAENFSAYLGGLAPVFSQLASNASEDATRQATAAKYIKQNATKAEELVTKAENVSQQAVRDLNSVEQLIYKLYAYAQETREYGLTVNATAFELYTNASAVLADVLEARDAVHQLQPDNSERVREIDTAAANATAQARLLIDRATKLTEDFASDTSEVREAAAKSRELMRLVEESEARGAAILGEAQRAKAEGEAAVNLANKTLSDSQEMLSILRNFTQMSQQAEKFADDALRKAQQVNKTSWEAIQLASQLNASLQVTHSNASESRLEARMARDISKEENENVSSVHTDAARLKTLADGTQYTVEYLETMKRNTTAIGSSSGFYNDSCRNKTETAEKALKNSEEAWEKATKADRISKDVKSRVDRVMSDTRNLQQVNATRLLELKVDIENLNQTLTDQNAKDLQETLEKAKVDQKKFIDDYKGRVKRLKAEVLELAQLHASLASVSCN